MSLAIDVALIPKLVDSVKQINSQVFEAWPAGFLFDENHLPHLTLLQIFVDREQLMDFHKELELQLADFDLSNFASLECRGFSHHFAYDPDVHVVYLDVELTESLGKLQKSLQDLGRSYHQPEASEKIFFDQANSESQEWVRRYTDNSRFNPHITLGLAPETQVASLLSGLAHPSSISFENLVSAQLGNHCTLSSNIYRSYPLL